jgi:hypothetical protein
VHDIDWYGQRGLPVGVDRVAAGTCQFVGSVYAVLIDVRFIEEGRSHGGADLGEEESGVGCAHLAGPCA